MKYYVLALYLVSLCSFSLMAEEPNGFQTEWGYIKSIQNTRLPDSSPVWSFEFQEAKTHKIIVVNINNMANEETRIGLLREAYQTNCLIEMSGTKVGKWWNVLTVKLRHNY